MKENIIRQYRKKPVIVEAVQLDNINVPCVVRWIGVDKAKIDLAPWKLGKAHPILGVTICTLEGNMKAMPGDYIIKGVHGEFYPCRPDIFEQTYEAVELPKEESVMGRLVKFETMAFPSYNHNTKEWEYLPAKPDGVVFINAERVQYIAAVPNGEAVYLSFGPSDDDCVYLRQTLDSVVETLMEAHDEP